VSIKQSADPAVPFDAVVSNRKSVEVAVVFAGFAA
jgi:hypothetical protein